MHDVLTGNALKLWALIHDTALRLADVATQGTTDEPPLGELALSTLHIEQRAQQLGSRAQLH
jgi:hypothetical protein